MQTKEHSILQMYNGTRTKTLGSKLLKCYRNGKYYLIKFLVVKKNVQTIIGCKDSQRCKFIKVLENDEINYVDSNTLDKDELLNTYGDVFSGRGILGKEYEIVLDPSVTPVIDPPRRVPFTLHKQLREKLDDMEKKGYIVKMSEPSDWVSSLVVVKKPESGKLRICLDPTHLNKAIKRHHYQMPCIDEIVAKLGEAKVFSVVDAKDGFWQVPLKEESSALTCFNTPFGRYRWTVMPFGIKSAPEVFQQRMVEALEGLNGVAVVADDVLIYGEGETMEQAKVDHDINLRKLMDRCRERKIKLNKEKIKLRKSELTYIGHVLTKNGLKADPRKIEAVKNMKSPDNIKALKRFLGMVSYLQKFLPDISSKTESLRMLDRKNVDWMWTTRHEKDCQMIKDLICKSPILKYFDQN